SEVGEGSTFTAAFPASVVGAAAALSRAAGDGGARAEGPTQPAGADILIIEDDPSAVRLLRRFLEADGYRVRAANDGTSGLAAARADPPAAILLDILLPGIDGWEILREFKADPALRD